jgi:hypothetical protein
LQLHFADVVPALDLNSVSIGSNNLNPSYAVIDNEVTVNFASNEILANASVLHNGAIITGPEFGQFITETQQCECNTQGCYCTNNFYIPPGSYINSFHVAVSILASDMLSASKIVTMVIYAYPSGKFVRLTCAPGDYCSKTRITCFQSVNLMSIVDPTTTNQIQIRSFSPASTMPTTCSGVVRVLDLQFDVWYDLMGFSSGAISFNVSHSDPEGIVPFSLLYTNIAGASNETSITTDNSFVTIGEATHKTYIITPTLDCLSIAQLH